MLRLLRYANRPVGLWEKNLSNFLKDLRRRFEAIPEATKLLQKDQEATKHAMRQVQETLKDMRVRLKVEDFSLGKPKEKLPTPPDPCANPMNKSQEQRREVEISIKSFNEGQKAVFSAVVSEILPRITADDRFAPVFEPTHSYKRK